MWTSLKAIQKCPSGEISRRAAKYGGGGIFRGPPPYISLGVLRVKTFYRFNLFAAIRYLVYSFYKDVRKRST